MDAAVMLVPLEGAEFSRSRSPKPVHRDHRKRSMAIAENGRLITENGIAITENGDGDRWSGQSVS
jgi:hypothetical protein